MEGLEAKIAAADECHSNLAQLKSQCDTELRKAQQLPEKAARQSRTVETLNTQLESQHNKLRAQCEASDALIFKGQEELENLETEHATTMVEVERGQYATEAQDRSVSEVQKQFHLKQFEAEQILAKQVRILPPSLTEASCFMSRFHADACSATCFVAEHVPTHYTYKVFCSGKVLSQHHVSAG